METEGDFLGDLRRLNGCGGNAKQDVFWEQLDNVLEETATAAHAWRYGAAGTAYASELLVVPCSRQK